MYKKRNNTTDASRTAWRRRRSTQATQLKVTEHVVGKHLYRLVSVSSVTNMPHLLQVAS